MLGKALKTYRYRHLPHGLISMAVPNGLPQAYHFENLNLSILKKEFNCV